MSACLIRAIDGTPIFGLAEHNWWTYPIVVRAFLRREVRGNIREWFARDVMVPHVRTSIGTVARAALREI